MLKSNQKKMLICLGILCSSLVFTSQLAITSSAEDSAAADKKPIGWMRNPTGSSFHPLYSEDLRAGAKSISADAAKLADTVEVVKFDPNAPKDEVEKQFSGAMSLARHQADINALRDEFVDCMTAMQDSLQARQDEGKMTAEAQKQFDECQTHCDSVMKTMDSLHKNTSSLRTATRQQYFLNAWDKHKKLVAELRTQTAQCPAMFDTMIEATGTPSKGDDKAHKTMDMPK